MSSDRGAVEAIVQAELRHVLGADRVIEGGAVLVEVGVTSLKLLELSARVGLRLGLAGDPPSTGEVKTVRDFVEVFERHLAEPRQDDLALGASVNRAQRRLRLRGSNR
jgi:hypothetical protein